MNGRLAHILRYWLPVAIWLAIIVVESTDALSSAHTGHFLAAFLTALFGPVSRHYTRLLNEVLRKSGHFVGYGTLCLLFFRALRASFSGTVRRWALSAIGLTCVVASLDELHQSFIPSRGGRVRDVFLDTFGAACMLLLVLVLLRVRRKHTCLSKSSDLAKCATK